MSASKFTASNLVPRPNLERLADTLPKPTLDTLWKARGCHLNALEGFPLFAAAMVSVFAMALRCPIAPVKANETKG